MLPNEALSLRHGLVTISSLNHAVHLFTPTLQIWRWLRATLKFGMDVWLHRTAYYGYNNLNISVSQVNYIRKGNQRLTYEIPLVLFIWTELRLFSLFLSHYTNMTYKNRADIRSGTKWQDTALWVIPSCHFVYLSSYTFKFDRREKYNTIIFMPKRNIAN